MKSIIALDSGPLGLLFQATSIRPADDCRARAQRHLSNGVRIIVPEIVNYELRRKLLRLNRSAAVNALADFIHEVPGRFLPITSKALDQAAEM